MTRLTLLAFAAFYISPIGVSAQQTPPIAPKTVETATPAPPVIPSVPSPSDVPQRALSANEAAKIAVVHQPTIEQALQAINNAKGQTEQVRSAELPQVTVDAEYNHVTSLNTVNGQSSTAVQTVPGFLGTAELKQLIFDFEHTRELVKQSSLLETAAKDSLAKARLDLVFATKQAFYTYANGVRARQIAEANLASRRKQLALANAQLKVGLGLPSDVALAQTTVAQGVTLLINARKAEETGRISLALIMGIDPRTPILVNQDDEMDVDQKNESAMVDRALNDRPDIKIAEDNVQSASHGVKAARTNNAPVISGNFGLGTSGTSFLPQNDAFAVGVSVNWNPFDGGLTSGKIKSAKAAQATAESIRTGVKLSIISDVHQAYINLLMDEQTLVSARNSVTNASEDLRIATGRFSSGLGIFLDIITAETNLESAQSDLTVVTMNLDQDRAALKHAIGLTLPGM